MDGTRSGEPLSDSALDRELESALGIEPSAEFLARVRTRIAAEPEPSPWRLASVVSGFSRTRRWSVEPLGGLAIAGIVLAVIIPRWMRDEHVVTPAPLAIAQDVRRPTDAQGPIALAVKQPARTIPQRPAQTPLDSVHTVPLQLSPVLFAEEDQRAFALFVTAVADGRVPEKVVQTLSEEDMTPLAIALLEIDPLPKLAAVVQVEGEAKW